MAALTAVGALGCLVPPIQGVAREALRYGALACFGLVLWKLIDTPGANQVLEPRYGAFLATAAALIALTSGAAVASRRSRAAARRPEAVRRRRPPPSRYETTGSAAPPPASTLSAHPLDVRRRRRALRMAAVPEIRLLRHGETAGYAGDLGLSDRGRDQARAAAAALAAEAHGALALLHAPSVRARVTAEVLAEDLAAAGVDVDGPRAGARLRQLHGRRRRRGARAGRGVRRVRRRASARRSRSCPAGSPSSPTSARCTSAAATRSRCG